MNNDVGNNDIAINMPDFMDRVEDDIELARDLVEIFLSDTVQKLHELKNYIAKNNAAGVRSVAHSIKGAAANLSALYIRNLANSLENMGASGDLTGAKYEFSRLISAMKEFKTVVSKEFGI